MAENRSIEVTEEMIDAGYNALIVSGIADEYLEADRLTVVDIYRAMQERSPETLAQYENNLVPSNKNHISR
jgi:hypothetical protein